MGPTNKYSAAYVKEIEENVTPVRDRNGKIMPIALEAAISASKEREQGSKGKKRSSDAVDEDKENAGPDANNGNNATKKTKKKNDGSAATSKKGAGSPDVSDVKLDGEDNDEVAVFEIRRKISTHLTRFKISQAQLVRDLQAQYHTDDAPKVSTRQLSTFRGKKGSASGNTSPVFYAAYVLFEKLRIKENKKKSTHREEMEKRWSGKGGIDMEHSADGYITCMAGERPTYNKYGELEIVSTGAAPTGAIGRRKPRKQEAMYVHRRAS